MTSSPGIDGAMSASELLIHWYQRAHVSKDPSVAKTLRICATQLGLIVGYDDPACVCGCLLTEHVQDLGCTTCMTLYANNALHEFEAGEGGDWDE